MKHANKLTSDQRDYLQELGLSADAISLYDHLLVHGRLNAQSAAMLSHQFANAQYRLFYKLEDYGLVRRMSGRPIEFEPIDIQTGFSAAYLTKEARLKQQLVALTNASAMPSMQLLFGRQALYSKYMQLADRAAHDIDVFAIGIAYSEELRAVQQRARRRGVRIRHVIQQIRPENYHVMHAWRRLGVRLRLLPTERGFHLMIFDNKWVLVSFSNPTDTEDRLSMLTDNPAAYKLFAKYFEAVWDSAGEVEI